jgi:hypothetical protein
MKKKRKRKMRGEAKLRVRGPEKPIAADVMRLVWNIRCYQDSGMLPAFMRQHGSAVIGPKLAEFALANRLHEVSRALKKYQDVPGLTPIRRWLLTAHQRLWQTHRGKAYTISELRAELLCLRPTYGRLMKERYVISLKN